MLRLWYTFPVVGARFTHLCAAFLCVCAVACSSGAKAPATGETQTRVAERSVTFATSDGLTLTGRLFGSGHVGVVLAHMLPSDATSWYSAARKIADAGYFVLAFNFRGYDGSQGTKSTAGASKDLKAARDMLVGRGAQGVVLVGASTGGTAAIAAAGTIDPLAIVAISPPLRFAGLDAVVVAGRVQRPVLLMAARDDQPAMTSLETLSRALPNADTKVFDGSAHGTTLLRGRPEAVGVLIAFLQRYAPVTPGATPTP